MSDAIAGAPRWSPLGLLAALRATMRGEMRAKDVVAVVAALERVGVRSWLAGGWGVDALLGRQTRHHDDLDLVISDFDDQRVAACEALAPLGFQVASLEVPPPWMADCCFLEDGAGRRIDLDTIDWGRLRDTLGVAPPSPGITAECGAFGEAVSTGTVAGRELHCLSVAAQLIVHIGFEPPSRRRRSVDRHDLRVLAALSARTGRRY
ncbi:MAG: nucleotidyltransferase domain-containing protein [Acidimicrobiales bacterium]